MIPKGRVDFRSTEQKGELDLFNLKVFLVAAGILCVAFLGLFWLSQGEIGLGSSQPQRLEEEPIGEDEEYIEAPKSQTQLSQGEQILLNTSTMLLKTSGANAIAAKNYNAAQKAFENARNVDVSDPEALIYLNNANIGPDEAHSLAVIAPLETDPIIALNVLRGVAQAQTEINQAGGIQGKPLRLLLADDRGDLATSRQIATELSQSAEVIGVIGHSNPVTADAAAEIYSKSSLPFVSPTATAPSPSIQPLLFSRLPMANALAFYMAKLNHQTAILFYDGKSDYSLAFKADFEKALKVHKGTMTADIDLSDLPTSMPSKTPEAEIFVLSPGNSPLETATDSIEIIPNDKVDHFYRHVFGGHELFNPDVLNLFGSMATGTVLAVPDVLYQSAASPFSEAPQVLWETTVDWTTSASYTIVQSMMTGLTQSPTRQSVQQALEGATNDNVRLVRVQINPEAPTGYELLSIGVMSKDGFKPD